MIVGFISEWNLDDASQRSGVPFNIYKALKNTPHSIELISTQIPTRTFLSKLKSRCLSIWYNSILKKTIGEYSYQTSTDYLKQIASIIDHNVKTKNIDFIISINSFSYAYTQCQVKKILWLDNSYLSFQKFVLKKKNIQILSSNIKNERLSFKNTYKIVGASNWLKNEIKTEYNIVDEKFNIIERGANIQSEISEEVMANNLSSKDKKLLRLLFIGRNWHLKGGDIALKVCENLIVKGINVEFNIVGKINGCNINFDKYKWIKKYSSFSLSNKIEKEKLSLLFLEAHFLLVPSRADGFGIVFAEAATYGLPSIALDIMGVENSVINNTTGKRFNEIDAVPSITNYIFELYNNTEKYNQLCISAYRYSKENFDWNKNVKRVIQTCQ